MISTVSFRDRLLATLRAVRPVLEVPGVLVVGSEVPNLLEPSAAATLVVSQDVDIGIPIAAHAEVKRRLASIDGLVPSPEEPSVWVPHADHAERLIEVNFLGIDPAISDPADTYELEDSELPLMVFGALSLLRGGGTIDIDDLQIPMPHPAGLIVEKLLTDRAGEKGDRDLLVVAGLIQMLRADDIEDIVSTYRTLSRDLQHQVRSNLGVLLLLPARWGMPDPDPHRAHIAAIAARLEAS
jgi:hypothetical protein